MGGNSIAQTEVMEFYQCIEIYELIEVPHREKSFTQNDKGATYEGFSKIDWLFIKEEWLNNMPDTKSMFLLERISDHCPAKATMGDIKP